MWWCAAACHAAPVLHETGRLAPDWRLFACRLQGGQATLRHVGAPHHAGPVLGLATCIQRPVVATCGADKTIRLWNYLDSALELVRPQGLLLVRGGDD